MIRQDKQSKGQVKTLTLQADLVVTGGGMAGTCGAITAARAGCKVILVQDRPVLGGNASSEVRLWVLGATSHMSNNNRWAREGGVIDEILVENTYRNPEGNPVIFDTVILEKVLQESNITLLLNTCVYELEKDTDERIRCLHAFCSQNSTRYELLAPLFCDASGDGVVGFLAGAPFRMGAESRDEFNEGFAPGHGFGELLGHSIFFYSKDTGRPVEYHAPAFALKDISQIPRFRSISVGDNGCNFWWLEYGGRLDTVHESETIKLELWKIVYGVWDYVKNSGRFPESKTHTLEWVGLIPGKRESRRFEGDYILKQHDVAGQRHHDDAVSFGGWALDLHPADGVYSEDDPCVQWHAKGVYSIPYRVMYSRSIENLFLAGRIISASHVAFGSARVMATCAHNAQSAGMAAALCREINCNPRDLLESSRMKQLQQRLLRSGQYIPNAVLIDPAGLARQAAITASSSMQLAELPPDGPKRLLDNSWAMLVPLQPGLCPKISFTADVESDTELRIELRTALRQGNFTPDRTITCQTLTLAKGARQTIDLDFATVVKSTAYYFICWIKNDAVAVYCSSQRLTGIMAVTNQYNPAVAKSSIQIPPKDSGIDSFEFWRPQRRPDGHNLALSFDPPLNCFLPENTINGIGRPTTQPNAWAAEKDDTQPSLTLQWNEPKTIGGMVLVFDTDFDHALESVQFGHPERAMPFCVKHFRLRDNQQKVLFEEKNQYQTRAEISFDPPITTSTLTLEILETRGAPASLFEIQCYPPE